MVKKHVTTNNTIRPNRHIFPHRPKRHGTNFLNPLTKGRTTIVNNSRIIALVEKSQNRRPQPRIKPRSPHTTTMRPIRLKPPPRRRTTRRRHTSHLKTHLHTNRNRHHTPTTTRRRHKKRIRPNTSHISITSRINNNIHLSTNVKLTTPTTTLIRRRSTPIIKVRRTPRRQTTTTAKTTIRRSRQTSHKVTTLLSVSHIAITTISRTTIRQLSQKGRTPTNSPLRPSLQHRIYILHYRPIRRTIVRHLPTHRRANPEGPRHTVAQPDDVSPTRVTGFRTVTSR